MSALSEISSNFWKQSMHFLCNVQNFLYVSVIMFRKILFPQIVNKLFVLVIQKIPCTLLCFDGHIYMPSTIVVFLI